MFALADVGGDARGLEMRGAGRVGGVGRRAGGRGCAPTTGGAGLFYGWLT